MIAILQKDPGKFCVRSCLDKRMSIVCPVPLSVNVKVTVPSSISHGHSFIGIPPALLRQWCIWSLPIKLLITASWAFDGTAMSEVPESRIKLEPGKLEPSDKLAF